jgi:peptide deformylase
VIADYYDHPMLRLVQYPNKDLKRSCTPVVQFDSDLAVFVEQMVEMMYVSGGVGLAAPQVGATDRVLVMDPTTGDSSGLLRTLVNPQIVDSSSQMMTGEEGCLSIPGVKLLVPRHVCVTVEYLDIVGKQHKEAFVDLAAKIVQHEIDHLDGILMLDRVGPMQRQLAMKSLRKSG